MENSLCCIILHFFLGMLSATSFCWPLQGENNSVSCPQNNCFGFVSHLITNDTSSFSTAAIHQVMPQFEAIVKWQQMLINVPGCYSKLNSDQGSYIKWETLSFKVVMNPVKSFPDPPFWLSFTWRNLNCAYSNIIIVSRQVNSNLWQLFPGSEYLEEVCHPLLLVVPGDCPANLFCSNPDSLCILQNKIVALDCTSSSIPIHWQISSLTVHHLFAYTLYYRGFGGRGRYLCSGWK